MSSSSTTVPAPFVQEFIDKFLEDARVNHQLTEQSKRWAKLNTWNEHMRRVDARIAYLHKQFDKAEHPRQFTEEYRGLLKIIHRFSELKDSVVTPQIIARAVISSGLFARTVPAPILKSNQPIIAIKQKNAKKCAKHNNSQLNKLRAQSNMISSGLYHRA